MSQVLIDLKANLHKAGVKNPGVPLLILSGGFDSALIAQALAESNTTFDVVHLDFMHTGREKRAREKLAYAAVLAKYRNFIRYDVIQPLAAIEGVETETRYQQPWAQATVAALHTNPDTSMVLTGIVLTDENKFDDAFTSIYVGSLKTFHPQHWTCLTPPVCLTPLRTFAKSEVISAIDLKLAEHLTFCESLKPEDNCGECLPCAHFYSRLVNVVMPTYIKSTLLSQSNRTSGLLQYLANVNSCGSEILSILGLNVPGKSWNDINRDYYFSQLNKTLPEISPGDVGLSIVTDVTLDRAPKDSALGEDSCMQP